MKDILTAAQAARVIGCTEQRVRERIKRNIWTFGKVVDAKANNATRRSYEIKITELAAFLGITREEVEKRLETEKGG